MRVSVDTKVWTDPRVKRLSRRAQVSLRETVGTLLAVWTAAYDARSEMMSVIDLDTAAEMDGFAAWLVECQLADQANAETVRIRGVAERIEYLLRQAELGKKGGQKRIASAKRTPDGRLASTKPTPSDGLESSKGSPDLAIANAIAPDPDTDPDTELASKQAGSTRLSVLPNGAAERKARALQLSDADVMRSLQRFTNALASAGEAYDVSRHDARFAAWLSAKDAQHNGRAEPPTDDEYTEGETPWASK